MNDRLSSRLATLARIAGAGLLVCVGAAFAHDRRPPPPPPPVALPLEIVLTPLLSSITASQATAPTYIGYSVAIRNPNTWGLALREGTFSASTTVPSGSATYFSSNSANCPTAPSLPTTSIVCTLPDLAPGAAVNAFIVTFTSPTTGALLTLTGSTKARMDKDGDNDADDQQIVQSSASVNTPVTPANPNTVATYLPLATGGTVSTGTNGGAATCAQPWVTVASVPKSGTVNLDVFQAAPTCPGCKGNYSGLKIPGTFGTTTSPPADLLVITLRRDKCTIGDGDGDLDDALKILTEKIFYRGELAGGVDPFPGQPNLGWAQVYSCKVTGGPVAATATSVGRPCIASRKVYTPFNLPPVSDPNRLQYLGDHEWTIYANDNGKYQN